MEPTVKEGKVPRHKVFVVHPNGQVHHYVI